MRHKVLIRYKHNCELVYAFDAGWSRIEAEKVFVDYQKIDAFNPRNDGLIELNLNTVVGLGIGCNAGLT